MSELREIEPKLAAVREPRSGRNLLDPADPNPLTIDTTAGRNVRFRLAIENGPEGLMEMTITSDEPWLQPEKKRLTLVGGESRECVLAASPDGDAEFANLVFSWQGQERPLSASIMLMRTLATATESLPSPPATPRRTPASSAASQADTYRAEINRDNPTCFLFLVDQSRSMIQSFGGIEGRSKARCVADALNRLLFELVSRCSQGVEIRDYYDIGVIGYGDVNVASALGGELAGRLLVPVSEIGKHPLRVETRTKKEHDGAGGVIETTVKMPVWYEPTARGKTPMCGALAMAYECIQDFLRRHPQCWPPVIINITDGAANDGDPRPRATALRNLASQDGHVLLFNLHISSSSGEPIQYPVSDAALSEPLARMLFRMSSPIPTAMLNLARDAVPDIRPGARGFVFNADMVATVQMLDLGTKRHGG